MAAIYQALVHGDLWESSVGTVINTSEIYIFDAACYFAHHEKEVGIQRVKHHKMKQKVQSWDGALRVGSQGCPRLSSLSTRVMKVLSLLWPNRTSGTDDGRLSNGTPSECVASFQGTEARSEVGRDRGCQLYPNLSY
jgi:hypothetical protein